MLIWNGLLSILLHCHLALIIRFDVIKSRHQTPMMRWRIPYSHISHVRYFNLLFNDIWKTRQNGYLAIELFSHSNKMTWLLEKIVQIVSFNSFRCWNNKVNNIVARSRHQKKFTSRKTNSSKHKFRYEYSWNNSKSVAALIHSMELLAQSKNISYSKLWETTSFPFFLIPFASHFPN